VEVTAAQSETPLIFCKIAPQAAAEKN